MAELKPVLNLYLSIVSDILYFIFCSDTVLYGVVYIVYYTVYALWRPVCVCVCACVCVRVVRHSTPYCILYAQFTAYSLRHTEDRITATSLFFVLTSHISSQVSRSRDLSPHIL